MNAIVEFLSQGGYAFFVWGAYGMTLLLLAIEAFQLRRDARARLARIQRLSRLRRRETGQ